MTSNGYTLSPRNYHSELHVEVDTMFCGIQSERLLTHSKVGPPVKECAVMCWYFK